MKLVRFRAPSLQEALDQARRELGGEALLLGSRVVERKLLFLRRRLVEATFAAREGEEEGLSSLREEISRMREMLWLLSRRAEAEKREEPPLYPGDIESLYLALRRGGVSLALARGLADGLWERGLAGAGKGLLFEEAAKMVDRLFPPFRWQPGPGEVAAVVGPARSGRTSFLCRLLPLLSRGGHALRVVFWGEEPPPALESTCQALDIPLEAGRRLPREGKRLVLVDVDGEEARGLPADLLFLALPAHWGLEEGQAAGLHHRRLNTVLCFTHLDLCLRPGRILNWVAALGLPPAYLSGEEPFGLRPWGGRAVLGLVLEKGLPEGDEKYEARRKGG
jgi:hypothetical protein